MRKADRPELSPDLGHREGDVAGRLLVHGVPLRLGGDQALQRLANGGGIAGLQQRPQVELSVGKETGADLS